MVISAVWAILFWLSFTAVIVFTVLTVRNRGKPSHDQTRKQDKSI